MALLDAFRNRRWLRTATSDPTTGSESKAFLDKVGLATLWAKIKTWVSENYQALLVSGTNIKTINGESLLGSGDVTTKGGVVVLPIVNNLTTSYADEIQDAIDTGKIVVIDGNQVLAYSKTLLFKVYASGSSTRYITITRYIYSSNKWHTATYQLNVTTLNELPTTVETNTTNIESLQTSVENKADKSTTLSGYGITDAKIADGTITLGANSITPITSHQNIKTINGNSLIGSGDLEIGGVYTVEDPTARMTQEEAEALVAAVQKGCQIFFGSTQVQPIAPDGNAGGFYTMTSMDIADGDLVSFKYWYLHEAGSSLEWILTSQTITLNKGGSSSITIDTAMSGTSTNPVQNKVITSALDTLKTDIDTRAKIASPAFTGTPTAPTATKGTNTTQIATTAFVKTALDDKANKVTWQELTAEEVQANGLTLDPYTHYVIPDFDSDYFEMHINSFPDRTSENFLKPCFVQFYVGSGLDFSLTYPTGMYWANGELPTFEDDTWYQLSIVGGCAVCTKFATV